jgi:hypothetical protein
VVEHSARKSSRWWPVVSPDRRASVDQRGVDGALDAGGKGEVLDEPRFRQSRRWWWWWCSARSSEVVDRNCNEN